MRVLFALNNDSNSRKIAQCYQESNGNERIEYKCVYYFRSLIDEVKKNKNYDRIIIHENLETISVKNQDAIDKFLFNNIDKVTDECGKADIIIICSENRTNRDDFIKKLFNIGIYTILTGDDRTVGNLCKYIKKPLTKKEAKSRYEIDVDSNPYEEDNNVNEIEIRNIIAFYEKNRGDYDKVIKGFDSLYDQYTMNKLRIIIGYLPGDVQNMLANGSEKFRIVVGINGAQFSNVPPPGQNPNRGRKGASDMQFVEQPPMGPQQPPMGPQQPPMGPQQPPMGPQQPPMGPQQPPMGPQQPPMGPQQPPIVEEKEDVAKLQENSTSNMPKRPEMPSQPISQVQPQIKVEVSQANTQPNKPKMDAPVMVSVKVPNNPNLGMRTEPNKPKIPVKPTMNKIEENIDKEQIPVVEIPKPTPPPVMETPKPTPPVMETPKPTPPPVVETPKPTPPPVMETPKTNPTPMAGQTFVPPVPPMGGNAQGGFQTITQVIDKTSIQTVYETPSDYKKAIAFVGSHKVGTTFTINAIAAALTSNGIKTAIIDLTRNKDMYMIYAANDDEMKEVAANSLANLSAGVDLPLRIGRLSIYTALPRNDKTKYDCVRMLDVARKENTVVLIDADFTTPLEVFRLVQNIYIVQDMDILNLMPITMFLRELKHRDVDITKSSIIINKYVRCALAIPKLIEGLSYFSNPEMTFVDELLPKNVRKFMLSFDEQNYIRYVEGVYYNKMNFSGFSDQFKQELATIVQDVYPISGNGQKNNQPQKKGGFWNRHKR